MHCTNENVSPPSTSGVVDSVARVRPVGSSRAVWGFDMHQESARMLMSMTVQLVRSDIIGSESLYENRRDIERIDAAVAGACGALEAAAASAAGGIGLGSLP